MLTEISKREEEERIRLEQLAEAKRNSLWGKTKGLIISVVPKGVLVFLMTMLIAPYLLLFFFEDALPFIVYLRYFIFYWIVQ